MLRYFVAVAEERHVGRAAARLHMTQPPLSRAIRGLEAELGSALLERTARGVTLTPPGEVLLVEARALLEHAERARSRVATAAGAAHLVLGTLADTVEHLGELLVTAFRLAHPDVTVSVHEADLSDPSAGLRAGRVDVALTRTPFDTSGLAAHTLASEALGVALRASDPLAAQASVRTADLTGRSWVRLPEGTDRRWRDWWSVSSAQYDPTSPPRRTIQECLQAVLWNGATALAPLGQRLPAGLVLVPVRDRAPSRIVVAWRTGDTSPLVQAFVATAAAATGRSSPASAPAASSAARGTRSQTSGREPLRVAGAPRAR